MNWNMLPTVLWSLPMVVGIYYCVKNLRRVNRRRAIQRRHKPDDILLAEVANHNVAAKWLRLGSLGAFALAGLVILANQVTVLALDPVTVRWIFVVCMLMGGACVVAGEWLDEQHGQRAHRLALDGLTDDEGKRG